MPGLRRRSCRSRPTGRCRCRRWRGAGQRPRVAGVGRHASRSGGAGDAGLVQASQACAAPGPVRLEGLIGADRCAGSALGRGGGGARVRGRAGGALVAGRAHVRGRADGRGGRRPAGGPVARKVWSVQTGAPDPHSVVAVTAHGLVDVQAAPWLQAVHTCVAEQTAGAAGVPQEAPVARKVWSVQTGAPDPHSVVAVAAHGLVEVQRLPGCRRCRRLRRTRRPCRAVPFATFPVRVQTGSPSCRRYWRWCMVRSAGEPRRAGAVVPGRGLLPPGAAVHDVGAAVPGVALELRRRDHRRADVRARAAPQVDAQGVELGADHLLASHRSRTGTSPR